MPKCFSCVHYQSAHELNAAASCALVYSRFPNLGPECHDYINKDEALTVSDDQQP